ncbi:MAG: peptide-methionine (S)-S-oxide reductase MsrA [Candidatus Hermodarchaeota archaeon]
MGQEEDKEVATLGGGCFWCLEAIFNDVQGIEKVESGYSGGNKINPSYEEVCTGTTGHAEVVQIEFKPKIINFQEILEIFFSIHDPTQLNRQGNDIGPQYRSVIFYHSSVQKKVAERIILNLEEGKTWKNPIVTELTAFETFYRAEEYHQEYYRKNPNQPYCNLVISPKIFKFRKLFGHKLKM